MVTTSVVRRAFPWAASVALALASPACGSSSPSEPFQLGLAVAVDSPVAARAGAEATWCAEFPVVVRNLRTDSGATLVALHVWILAADSDTVVGENRRPNATFVFPDTAIAAGGSLTAEAAACYLRGPQTPAALRARVRAEVSRFGTTGESREVVVPVVEAV